MIDYVSDFAASARSRGNIPSYEIYFKINEENIIIHNSMFINTFKKRLSVQYNLRLSLYKKKEVKH